MNILADITAALSSVTLPIETGVYTGLDDNYIVLTPLGERNDDISDNTELTETSDCDVNIYHKGNYQTVKNQIVTLLKAAGFFIADRRYIGYENDGAGSGRHHYVITAEKKEVL